MLLVIFNSFSLNKSVVDIWSTWWLIIRLSPNVEASEVFLAICNHLQVDPCYYWRAQNSHLTWAPCLSRILVEKTPARVEFTFTGGFGHISEVALTIWGIPNKVSTWHLLSTNNKYLSGYTKRRRTKYKLLLKSSDISA